MKWGLLTFPLVFSVAFLVLLLAPKSGSVPKYSEVRAGYQASEAVLLDRHGTRLQELRADDNVRSLRWLQLDEISPALAAAVVYAEDRKFYTHHGVDWRGVGGAALRWIGGHGDRGASTITMQLAGLLDSRLHAGARGRHSVTQKLIQFTDAQSLESSWSKQQILEAYFNLVSFRGELRGIGAAAKGLFGAYASGLTDTESAILAAMLRSPNATAARVVLRACAILKGVRPAASCELLEGRVRQLLAGAYSIPREVALAPHVALRLLTNGRREVTSTLDGGLQRFVIESLSQHLAAVSAQNVHDGAVLVVDNETGDVLAYVGNTGAHSSAIHVDGVVARRQAGSTLKPFLYALAFEMRRLTAASLLDDSPLDVTVGHDIYRPQNYDHSFHGPVSARVALASSLNVPAVRTLQLVGVDALVERLGASGFTELRSAEDYGPSLALGSADINHWELVNAYRTFANSGVWSELQLEHGVVSERHQAYRPATAFLISDILSDRESRAVTFGLENQLATRFWSAVKTGTSKDMRDNWCVGYSRRFTVGVWVGNFSGAPMWNVSGITGAAPVWAEVMNYLHADATAQLGAPLAPKGLIHRGNDWFLRGTEPVELAPLAPVLARSSPSNLPSQTSLPRITYPSSEMIVALDPDIAPERQRIALKASGGEHLRWILNGRELGSASGIVLWRPVNGEQSLSLVDAADGVVDSVHFTVRGHDRRELPTR